MRGRGQQVAEQDAELVAQVLAGDDAIDEAVFHHELRRLETGRQVLVGGFLHHTRTGESDHALGLGEVHIADGGERSGDAAGGRMRHD